MAPSSRDRISVDLRGLRAALLAQARARGVTPSDLVRGVLAGALGDVDSDQRVLGSATQRSAPSGRVRLSLRLTAEQARAITLAAKAAELSTGDFVAGLVAGLPVLSAIKLLLLRTWMSFQIPSRQLPHRPMISVLISRPLRHSMGVAQVVALAAAVVVSVVVVVVLVWVPA